ncbi:hypothetical protein ACFW1A_39120, partial [Kitasatospora sp. NPDC058965]
MPIDPAASTAPRPDPAEQDGGVEHAAAPEPGSTAARARTAEPDGTPEQDGAAVKPDRAGAPGTAGQDTAPPAAAGPPAAGGLRQVLGLARGWSAVLAVAVAAGTGATLALPAVLARAVDGALGGRGSQAAVPLAAVLALLAGADALGQYAGPRICADAAARLRGSAVHRVLAGSPLAAGRLPVGEVAARLTASAPQAALAAPAVVYTA